MVRRDVRRLFNLPTRYTTNIGPTTSAYKVGDRVILKTDNEIVTITRIDYPHVHYNIEVDGYGIVSEEEILRPVTPLDEALL